MLISPKQKRMLEESERMIVDSNQRLGAAVIELRDLIVGFIIPRPHVASSFYLLVFTTDPVQS